MDIPRRAVRYLGSILLMAWGSVPDVWEVAFAVGSEGGEGSPCLGEAEVSVGAAPDQRTTGPAYGQRNGSRGGGESPDGAQPPTAIA